jgi:hypothetical protein
VSLVGRTSFAASLSIDDGAAALYKGWDRREALRRRNAGKAISNLKFQISKEEKTDGDGTLGDWAG